MEAVLVGPPADLIAERQRLGLDRFDEVWNGEYHMVPTPSDEHQRLGAELVVALMPVVRSLGLELRYEFNLIAPNVTDWSDFRVPDLIVFGQDARGESGVIGAPHLVVELRSPGDESLRKLGFYERVGAREVVIIDRDTKAIRRWVLERGRLVEAAAASPAGVHHLRSVPVSLHVDAGVLCVAVGSELTRI